MDDTYCAFCGVCFGIDTRLYHGRLDDTDTDWTEYFIALRRRRTSPHDDRISLESWYLSGVGEDISWDGRAPPPGYDAREQADDSNGELVVAYTNRGQNFEIVYPIHPACWDIFLQNHAVLAKENASKPDLDTLGQLLASQSLEEGHGRGLRPDWTDDYLGPEQFWADGWLYHEEPEASEVAGVLDYSAEWDFLVHDPTGLPNFDELFNSPPLVPSEQTSCISHIAANQGHDFPHLPAEVVLKVLCLLPTLSVQALRLASRQFGSVHLNSIYWRSRFDYPNELCHIQLPSTFLSGQHESSHINWSALCERLLHSLEPYHPAWQNRKRISSLTRRLVERLLSIKSNNHVEDRPRNDVKPSLNYRQIISCHNQPSFSEASALFSDLSPTGVIRSISVTFRPINSALLLTGIEFCGTNGTARLGSCTFHRTHRTVLHEGESLKRLIAAVTPLGIVGLEFTIQTQSAPNQARKSTFGDFNDKVALGQLGPDNDIINGIGCGFAKDGRIVSIGLLEPQAKSSHTQALPSTPAISSYLWHPALPPKLNTTTALGLGRGNEFSYMDSTIFAMDAEALCHLSWVSAFLSLEPHGTHGFRFHFDNRDPIPAQSNTQGKDVTFFIDGPGGERISAVDVLWSEQTNTVGAEFVTNHNRRSCFTTADVSGNLRIARRAIAANSFVAGVFGEISVSNEKKSAYHKFGLFWSSGPHSTPTALNTSPVDDRQFDDHFNVWTDSYHPPPEYILGEAIGSQPNHGFINWIGFDKPIERLTVCLGTHTRNFRNDPVELSIVGIKFDIQGSRSTLLGRCTSLGPFFELDEGDCLTGITIGTHITQRSRIIKEILFDTKRNLRIGFKDGKIATSNSVDCEKRSLKSTRDLCLVGLAWSFDLGPGSAGDHGIQPVYRQQDNIEILNTLQHDLYPSLVWTRPPPQRVRLRPIPEMRSNRFAFTSSLAYTDNIDHMADYNLIAIRVYFNAFLQGIVFEYKSGQMRAIGNEVGIQQVFRLENERITAIWFHERVQKLFAMSLPREVICVDGIKFGVAKWVDGQPQERRFSPFFGCAQPFGPFINNQRGLWNPHGGGSANWDSCFKAQTTKIVLEPGTSCAGLYAESSSTFIRRAGVLISNSYPLPDDFSGLIDPSSQSESLDDLEIVSSESPPWLGPSPSATLKISHVVGQQKGKYRLWCQVPPRVYKATIYRHKTSEHKLVTIGLEFYHDVGSTLLGFRTLWTEHSKEVEFDEGEKIIGVRFERDNRFIQGNIDVLTSRKQTHSNNDEKSQVIVSVDTANVVGFHAYIDEFIEGIGVLYEER